jgi:uncharacterized membrane protein YgdD (TMEM256/DUF423 family)
VKSMRGGVWITTGSFLAFVAVLAGAFGAHGLKTRLEPEALDIYEVAVKYQMYHSLALILVGVLSYQPSAKLSAAAWAFVSGIIIFSGSLYLLALTGLRWLGAITPIGGVAFLIGWLVLTLKFSWTSRTDPRE